LTGLVGKGKVKYGGGEGGRSTISSGVREGENGRFSGCVVSRMGVKVALGVLCADVGGESTVGELMEGGGNFVSVS
jgi:hypothetical protein